MGTASGPGRREGVSSWIIGIAGAGCVTTWWLEDELDVIVAVDR